MQSSVISIILIILVFPAFTVQAAFWDNLTFWDDLAAKFYSLFGLREKMENTLPLSSATPAPRSEASEVKEKNTESSTETQPVKIIERIIERIEPVREIIREVKEIRVVDNSRLDAFSALISGIESKIGILESKNSAAYGMISLSQRIDSLDSIVITNGIDIQSGGIDISNGNIFLTIGSITADSITLRKGIISQTATTSLANLTVSGSVGIGTTAPDEKLTVIGGAIRTDQAFKDAFGWTTFSQKQSVLSLAQNGLNTYISPGTNFINSSSWSAYNAGSTGGLTTKGYAGAVFDGRYVYFVPIGDDVSNHGRVLRYDTTGSFTTSAFWSAYDAGSTGGLTTKGYVGGVFDGRYIYFVPYEDDTGNVHGTVLRYDTASTFSSSSSWSAYNAGSTGGLTTKGYFGAVFDGRYIYFVPIKDNAGNYHGVVLRYDTASTFSSSSSWSAYDAGSTGGLTTKGYAGAVFDGKYVYFIPDGTKNFIQHGKFLRYDTSGSFTNSSSWSSYNAESTSGLVTKGYVGGVFDGRYIYFSPDSDGVVENGKILRYDTASTFSSSSSWSAYDAGSTGGLTTKGYLGAVFDGRYIYFVPFFNGSTLHGVVLRYDTVGSFTTSASWSAYDAGSTGGLTTRGYVGGIFDGRYAYFSPQMNASGFHGYVLRYDTGSPLSQQSILQTARSSELFINSSGSVGIGTTSPYQMLSVAGGAAFPGIANAAGTAYICTTLATGIISTSTSACNPSALKYKENIEEMSYGLAEILKLRTISYDYKPQLLVPGRQIGFLAEDMHKVIPEIVGLKDGEPDNIDYAKLTAVLAKAVRELDEKVKTLGSSSLGGLALTNAWSVEQISGKVNVNFFGALNLQGNNILDAKKISGYLGKWAIDEDGTIMAVKIITKKLELGSPLEPTEITVYDENGKAGCLKIKNIESGGVVVLPGVCGSSEQPPTESPSPVESSVESPEVSPIVSPEPLPAGQEPISTEQQLESETNNE